MVHMLWRLARDFASALQVMAIRHLVITGCCSCHLDIRCGFNSVSIMLLLNFLRGSTMAVSYVRPIALVDIGYLRIRVHLIYIFLWMPFWKCLGTTLLQLNAVRKLLEHFIVCNQLKNQVNPSHHVLLIRWAACEKACFTLSETWKEHNFIGSPNHVKSKHD